MAKTKTTPKIESFNSANVKALLAECEVALREIAQRHGLTLTRKNCRWRNNEFALPFQMIAASEDAVEGVDSRATALIADYVRHCERFGLQKHWIGKSFEHPRHDTLTIIGLAPKSTHYPVVVQTQRGARYKLPACDVRELMQPNENTAPCPRDRHGQFPEGTKVVFKNEGGSGAKAHGPAWIRDPENPDRKLRLSFRTGQSEVVEDTRASNDFKSPDPAGWVTAKVAQCYAASIGATFEEG